MTMVLTGSYSTKIQPGPHTQQDKFHANS